MWEVIVISLALSYGLARIIVSSKIDEIIGNWAQYRCDPPILITANLFKPKTDPRSGADFAMDNFTFCTSELAKWALSMALKPVFDVFYQMVNAAIQSIGFTMNLRTLAASLYNGLMRIVDIFARRFNLTIHQIHRTFLLQVSAFQKANAIANASIYAGISILRTIMNLFELMIIVVISILVILVVLVIFLFFIFAPVLPVIIVAISIISATAFAGSVGGMAGAFCFDPETEVLMADGSRKSMKDVKNGDRLADKSYVTAVMRFKTEADTQMWSIDGVSVSGSHILYNNGSPVFVRDYKHAVKLDVAPSTVYCLNTTSHRIPVKGLTKQWTFADWEELDDVSMDDWDTLVRNKLGAVKRTCYQQTVESEAGLSPTCKVLIKTADGIQKHTEIQNVVVGDYIADTGLEGWTMVVGVVDLVGSESKSYGQIGSVQCSGANWIRNMNGQWCRASESQQWTGMLPVSRMVSLFTNSGTFKVDNIVMRDFSDIGLDKIEESYAFTLPRLNTSGAPYSYFT